MRNVVSSPSWKAVREATAKLRKRCRPMSWPAVEAARVKAVVGGFYNKVPSVMDTTVDYLLRIVCPRSHGTN